MKKFLSMSVIYTKLVFLACFSLMGVFPFNSAVAEVVSPCHQMVVESEAPQGTEEECPACDIAQDGWELQQVYPEALGDVAVVESFVTVSGWADLFTDIIEEVTVVSVPDPPDDVSVWHAELIVKKSTVLVI